MALQTVGGPVNKEGVSRLTTEYLYFPITTDDDLSSVNPDVAFLDTSEVKPVSTDWNEADMVSNPDDFNEWAVRILIGPELDGVDLTPPNEEPKTYHVWVRLTTTEEIIIRRAGTLKIR